MAATKNNESDEGAGAALARKRPQIAVPHIGDGGSFGLLWDGKAFQGEQ